MWPANRPRNWAGNRSGHDRSNVGVGLFRNLGKGLYSPAGYAGLINYYIKASHSPAAWKAIMGLMASHAAMAAPLQAIAEISLGILLVIGLLTRPAALAAFLYLGSLGYQSWVRRGSGNAGSGPCIAWAGSGTRRPCLGN